MKVIWNYEFPHFNQFCNLINLSRIAIKYLLNTDVCHFMLDLYLFKLLFKIIITKLRIH